MQYVNERKLSVMLAVRAPRGDPWVPAPIEGAGWRSVSRAVSRAVASVRGVGSAQGALEGAPQQECTGQD